VEREGQVRSFHLRSATVTADTVKPIIAEVLSTDSHFRTDESGIYWKIGETFASHRGDPIRSVYNMWIIMWIN
jgi:hypothetical protein